MYKLPTLMPNLLLLFELLKNNGGDDGVAFGNMLSICESISYKNQKRKCVKSVLSCIIWKSRKYLEDVDYFCP